MLYTFVWPMISIHILQCRSEKVKQSLPLHENQTSPDIAILTQDRSHVFPGLPILYSNEYRPIRIVLHLTLDLLYDFHNF